MSDEMQKGLRPERFMVPGGGGIEPHPGGLLYRRIDADAIIDGLRISLDAAEARIAHAEAENKRLRRRLNMVEGYARAARNAAQAALENCEEERGALRGEGEERE